MEAMSHHCEHTGYHSGVAKYSPVLESVRFVLVCDQCGMELREVHAETYAPQYVPGQQGQQAA